MGPNPTSEPINPFPGLRPFLPEEKNMFFGRESESGDILRKLLKNRILTVIGSSGCGKSSLINCGVVPEMISLTEKDKSSLKIISFQPGNDPVGNMTNAFAQAISGKDNFGNRDKQSYSHLLKDHDWIASTVKKLLMRSEEKVLIIIDQFEELFTHSSEKAVISVNENTSEFVTLLENAVRQTAVDIYIVLVIGSDYIGECAHIQGLTKLINDSNYLVPQMTRGNYKSVFENSFLSAGTRINPRLVQTVLDDISDLSDPLAILQHLMMRIYSYWYSLGDTGRPVDLSDYMAVGTIGSAMSNHAEEAYEELTREGKEICRKMFQAMAGDKINKKGIRHPLSISSLKSILQCSDDEIFEVIEKFRIPSRSFLTPGYKITLDEKSVIDFSTERLIRSWDRLKSWFDEELSGVRIYRQLSEASEMYQKGKATLLKDPDLQQAVKWRDTKKPTLSWAKRYDPAFERVMVYLRTSEKAYYEKEVNKAGRQRLKVKRSKITAVIFGFVVIISFGYLLFAFTQKVVSDRYRSEIDRQKAMAPEIKVADQNAAPADKKLAKDDSVAVNTVPEKIEGRQMTEVNRNKSSAAEHNIAEVRNQLALAIEQSDSAMKEAITADVIASNAIKQKNEAQRRRMISIGKSMSIRSLQLSGQKDLQTLLAYQAYKFNKTYGGSPNDGDIFNGLYNVARFYVNNNNKSFTGHEGEIKDIAFVPGKSEFFTSGSDGKVIKWDLNGKNQNLQIVYSGTEIINVLAISPDAGWLACGGQNSGIKMVPIKGKDLSYELKGHTGPIKSLIFSVNGRYLYSASPDGKVLKWDLTSRNSIDISVSTMQTTSIDLSTDNKYIAGVSNDGKVIVWNPDVTNDNFRIESPGKVIRSVKFKPDENILAIGYSDGYVDLWDISARKKVSEIKAHNSEVLNIIFNKKLSQMATAGNDKSIRLWDMNDPSNLPISFDDNEGLVFAIEFSPDGQVIVSGTADGKNNLMSRPVLAELLVKDLASDISRNFTVEEWQAYVGKDIDYEKTFSESDFKIKVDPIK